MKRLVLCFDGTWNAVADPKTVTNVVRLANLVTVNSGGVDQICYYNSGVGSGGPIDRFIGGAFGAGLKSNVKRGLSFLALNYDEGDEIYLFGFSRGAYTARALAGVIGVAGLPLDIRQSEVHWEQYRRVAQLRDQRRGLERGSAKRQAIEAEEAAIIAKLKEVSRFHGGEVPITCVGVWDTVGAYGIPSGFGLSSISRIFTYWTRGFRDTQIGSAVKLALHAMAVDEMRPPFVPTFWTLRQGTKLEAQEVEQVWFPGVHSNVGGGYDDCGLSDLALAWMVARVSERTGLKFNKDEVLDTVWPCSACTLYRSSRGGWFSKPRAILPVVRQSATARLFRAIVRLFGGKERTAKERINEKVHWSVMERRGWPKALVEGSPGEGYAPRNLAAKIEQIASPTALELELIDRGRPWDGHCSLVAAGLPCQCGARKSMAGSAGQQPASVAA